MLEDHAEDVGVVERNRKLQIPALVWSVVFGFATGESRSVAEFRRSDNSTADETLCPSGFYQELAPELAEYLSGLPRN
jgi:putative transposase